MIDELRNSPVVWCILAFCSFIGIPSFIFTIYTWIKSKRKKVFSVARSSYQIARKGKRQVKKLSLSFGEKSIEDITITKLAIWNSGNEAIKSQDIASGKPLAIYTGEAAEILDAEIVEESDETSEFRLEKVTPTTIEMGFDYVDKQEGIIVQVIHTGEIDSFHVDCKIKGGEGVKGNPTEKRNRLINILRKVKHFDLIAMGIDIAFLFLCLVFVALATFNVIPKEWIFSAPDKTDFTESITLLFGFLLGTMLVVVPTYIYMLKRRLNLGVPIKLRKHFTIDVDT